MKTVERACELLDSLNSAILQIDQIPTTNPSVATAIYVCVLRGKLQLCDTIDDAKNILNYLKLCKATGDDSKRKKIQCRRGVWWSDLNLGFIVGASRSSRIVFVEHESIVMIRTRFAPNFPPGALFQAVGFSQLPVPFVACVLSSLFSTSGLDSSVNVDANGSSSASEHHAHADTSSVMDVMDAKVEKLDGGSDASFPYPIFSVDRDGWTIFHWAVAVGAVGLDAAGKSLFPRGDVGSISDSRRTTTDSLFDVILRKATTSGEHLVALENDAGESPFIMALYASDLVAVRKIVNSPGFSVAMYRPSDFASVLESTSAEEVRQCLLKLCLARSETIEEARSFIAEIQFDFSALNISNLMMELTGCESDDVLFGLDKNLIPFRAVLERCDFLAKVDEMDINMMPPDESDRARTIFELAVHAADDTLVNIILNLFGAKVVLLNSSGISILRDAIDACCEKCVRAILCKHPEGVKHLSDMVFYIEGENETNVEVTPLEYVRKKYGMKSGRMVQIIEDALLAARMIEVVSESDATEAVKSGATRAASAMTLAATLRDEREAEQKKYEERITNVVREAREDGSKFCNICIEKIPNRVIITCGHVFCETCLADMPPPRSLSKRSYKPVHCPTCKQKFYNWSVNEKRDVASAQVPQGSNGAIEKRCGSVMKIYF